MATSLTATVYFPNANCITGNAVRIDYTSSPATGCSTSTPGFYIQTACVDNISTFGNKYLQKDWTQLQSLSTDSQCSGIATGGWQIPYKVCSPVPNTTNSTMVVADPLSGSLFLSTYTDPSCHTLSSFKQYGSINGTSCMESNKITGSTAKVEYVLANSACTASNVCNRNEAIEYTTRSCSTTNDLTSYAKSVFAASKTPFFTLQEFQDTACTFPWRAEAIALNTCYSTNAEYEDNSIKSSSAALLPDGKSIRISYWSDINCQGKEVIFLNRDANSEGSFGVPIGAIVEVDTSLLTSPFLSGVPLATSGSSSLRPFSWINGKSNQGRTVETNSNTGEHQHSGSVTVFGTDPVVPSEKKSAEAKRASLFSGINLVASEPVRVGKMVTVDRVETKKNQEAYFGDLILPALPSQWKIRDVVSWVTKNDGSSELVTFVEEQEIDGQALLLLTEDQLSSYLKVGARVRFWEKLEELRRINATAADTLAPPPSYEV
ncbi:hypothetical protein BCR33DRAFT_718406 [Rhizoclosmatium globosum]|uniref:SAM domain-containing protein n=1 Tax=Rhizoclosmatium globosum TaxID=329046 RepID=A0A1Y2C7D3_9FUNG|nr:hypothetical protein BCR33DRAFT_718406 [Rhizoclosmatium globosum]|eukprot:ORY42215.1 hypothetical protein BCR33DRAFT_718406 [Rhizoclosmatium globosum]